MNEQSWGKNFSFIDVVIQKVIWGFPIAITTKMSCLLFEVFLFEMFLCCSIQIIQTEKRVKKNFCSTSKHRETIHKQWRKFVKKENYLWLVERTILFTFISYSLNYFVFGWKNKNKNKKVELEHKCEPYNFFSIFSLLLSTKHNEHYLANEFISSTVKLSCFLV